MRAAGSPEEVIEATTVAAWKHVVGSSLLNHAVPFRLYKKTLVVSVTDAVWQKQMQALSGQLLFRLNSLLGQAAVTSIKFRIDPGSVEEASGNRGFPTPGAKEGQDGQEPAPAEIVIAAASIRDPDLRRSFLRAASSCVKRLEKVQ